MEPDPIPSTAPYRRSGLARVSDLSTPAWIQARNALDAVQREFLARETAFRDPERPRTGETLHTWNRAWELPWIYLVLREWHTRECAGRTATVALLGCGASFVPFALARLGLHVLCLDPDPARVRDLGRAAEELPAGLGSVEAEVAGGRSLPCGDGCLDAAAALDVLGRAGDGDPLPAELRRALRPGGLFLATIELSLLEGHGLGTAGHAALLDALDGLFERRHPETTAHPADVLRSDRGPHARPVPARPLWAATRHRIANLLRGRAARPLVRPHFAVQALALARPAEPGPAGGS